MTHPITPESWVDVQSIQLDAGDTALSALMSDPMVDRPRGTVVALHGAGMNARYFHATAHPDTSLLRLAAYLGFRTVAIDRPGYGCSADRWPDGLPVRPQAEVILAALGNLRDRYDCGAGMMLLAHSFGGKVALMMTSAQARDIVGVDLAGCGRRYRIKPPDLVDSIRGCSSSWGPLRLYPQNTFASMKQTVVPIPSAEMADIAMWPRRFAEIASTVTVPIRLTYAEYEQWWCHDNSELEELMRCFPRSPRVVVDRQDGSGHNTSIGWAARAYHLRALGFFQDCLQRMADESKSLVR